MDFRIADTFTDALTRLPAQEQKAVKVSVVDLQLDPTAPGLQMHRIDKSKDPNFWSARVSRDLRLILHKTASSILVAYVAHHDQAYAWAERRRIETHPSTGAVQIVEVRERVEEAQPDLARLWAPAAGETPASAPPALFQKLSQSDLLSVGVPEDWLFPVQAASEESFYELAEHLPGEASEALLQYAATGRLGLIPTIEQGFAPSLADMLDNAVAEDTGRRYRVVPTPPDPFEHPDARRRFLKIETTDELRAALDAPWEKWSVWLTRQSQSLL